MTAQKHCPTFAHLLRGLGARRLPALLAAIALMPLGSAELRAGEAPRLPAKQELSGRQFMSAGLRLSADFYPGNREKDSVPVILLHMFKGDRKEYDELAPFLQRQGCAVLVPDLRGHGESTDLLGSDRKLDAEKMSSEHYSFMRYDDMERFRRFLVKKNDAGELNLNKLVLIGAEMGASVAAYYAFYDWTTPRREANMAAPSRDVKGLVLISPDWNFPNMPLKRPLSSPVVSTQISAMVVVGKEDSRAFRDARQTYSLLERYRKNETEKSLFFGQLATSLQGTKILGVPQLSLEQAIATFIQRRVADQGYEWYQRGKGE